MLKVDSLVYKLDLLRINKLKTGKITILLLALCIRYNDWLTIIDDTIYALSLTLYYAYKTPAIVHEKLISINKLKSALTYLKLSLLHKKLLKTIYNKLIGCSSCTFKKYAHKATDIVKQYPLLVSRYNLLLIKPIVFKYPKVLLPITLKVSSLIDFNFLKVPYTRRPCFDCVRKHIGSAYIKAILVIQGYSEHNTLSLGDLLLAYQECPILCTRLRKLLLFCISKSIRDGVMFIPILLLTKLLDIAIIQMDISDIAFLPNKLDLDMKLLLLLPLILFIKQLEPLTKLILRLLILDLHSTLLMPNDSINVLWSGYLARLAEYFIQSAPTIALVLRNRRLFFKEAPTAALGTIYDCSDILNIINLYHQ